MSAVDPQTMHMEHREAESEHVMWMEEIGRWRADHRRAASMLAQTQAALLEQDAALEAHAETVRAHESRLHRHEREIAEHQRGSRDLDDNVSVASHRALQAEHDQARDAHGRIRMHHETFVAELLRLSKKLSAPM